MEVEDFKNIALNNNLKDKLEKIIKTLTKDSNYKVYTKCQALLEYINICLLSNFFKVYLSDYNIMRIIKEYKTKDKELFEQMVSINAIYNITNTDATYDDIYELLLRTDYIYGYIEDKYGKIIWLFIKIYFNYISALLTKNRH